MASETTHEIVIVGGNYAAVGVAHKLLKAFPALEKETGKKFKVTMISNSTHMWFSVGAPRAMLAPYPKSLSDSFIPLTQGFSQYPSSIFAFTFAQVTSLDTTARTVTYTPKTQSDDTETLSPTPQSLPYNTLILATGSTGPSPLFSLHGSHLPTLAAYKDIHTRLPAAKSVLVVGGGSAGTETAGELGYSHGAASPSPKEITFLTGGSRILPGLRPAIGAKAETILTKMGVKVVHDVKLTSSTPLPDGKTKVELSNGDSKTVDILIQATGRKPSPSYLPADIPTTSRGQVETDGYLRVKSHPGVWANGDVASISDGTLLYLETMTPTLANNVLAELKGKKGEEGMKLFKPITTKETQLVPVGPKEGVGSIFGWTAPSFLVVQIKGKHFRFFDFTDRVMGKH